MRIFKGCVEAQKEILRDLYEMGTIVQSDSMQDKNVSGNTLFNTKELQGYTYSIINFKDMHDMEGLSYTWCSAELRERLSDEYINPGEAWKERKEVWDEFIHEGVFAYTYNNRIRTQLRPIINELKKRPNTRQAIINIHNNNMDLMHIGGVARIPCSMFYQFLIRKDKLDLYYVMRSCDFMTHWANDVWLAIGLLLYVSGQLGKETGKFIHFITSLHVYRKDVEGKNIF